MTWKIPQDWQQPYAEVVNAALYDNDVFSNFRRLKGYNYIMADSMPQDMAEALYGVIQQNEYLQPLLEWAKRTDVIGNPKIREPFGTSPRNLRYIYTAHLIHQNFGTEIEHVAEIGVGYGGLCWVLHGMYYLKGYTMFDIPNVVKLATKVLSYFRETSNIEPARLPYDLVVSECALTELDWAEVKDYYNKVILQSKHFLFRTNYHTQAEFDRLYQMLSQDFNVSISPLWPDGSIEKVCGRILLGTAR
jgi:hypothetical protein